MASRFEFAILDKANGKVIVKTEPRGTSDIVESLVVHLGDKVVDKIIEDLGKRGVGVFRTTAHVLADARAVIEQINISDPVGQTLAQMVFDLKAQVTPPEI